MNTARRLGPPLVLLLLAAFAAGQEVPAVPSQAAPPIAPAIKAIAKRGPQDAVTPTVKDPNRHAQFLERIKQPPPIDLLFLGDSITDFWPSTGKDSWEKLAPYHPADFGVSADRTEHVLWRIQNGELDGIHPKALVLLIGTNNIGHFAEEKPEWAAAGVKRIVEVIREKLPATKILLLAIFPRDDAASRARRANDEVNRLLAPLDDGKSIRWLDIGKTFLSPDGEIRTELMPDKLHPNAAGYSAWLQAMEPLLTQLMR